MTLAAALAAGCHRASEQDSADKDSAPDIAPATPARAQVPATPAPPTPAAARSIIRIKAGSSSPFTDSSGNVWQAEKGFNGGDVIERDAGTAIANTKNPGLYLSYHYSMDSFTLDLPNGKYTAKLYFAETYDGISGPGQRVFSFNVQGHEFKDFDIWVKAGGFGKAYAESVDVDVTDGKLKITFTPDVENPMINGIEILPKT